jgi:hypothetical protein
MEFGPPLRLPGGDCGAVGFDQTHLPFHFFYQFRGLTITPLGTGEHSLCMDALLKSVLSALPAE